MAWPSPKRGHAEPGRLQSIRQISPLEALRINHLGKGFESGVRHPRRILHLLAAIAGIGSFTSTICEALWSGTLCAQGRCATSFEEITPGIRRLRQLGAHDGGHFVDPL